VRQLVARYDHGEEDPAEGDDGHGGGGGGGPSGRGAKPMLFGVAIGAKRPRDAEDADEVEDGEDGTAEEDGEEDEEQDDDEKHPARGSKAARRNEASDLDVLALSVRAAAAARPGGGSRDRKSSVS
jgi:heat shock transcription factor